MNDYLISTGFYTLDSLLGGGLSPGELIVIGARPSMGKSIFGCQLAKDVAEINSKPTLIFSLEMDKGTIVTRFLCADAVVETSKLRQGIVTRSEIELLDKAHEKFNSIPIFIEDSPRLSVAEISDCVRSMQSNHDGNVGLVVIDCLQLLVNGDDPKGFVSRTGEVARRFKLLARECLVPIILLSGVNRKAEERTNKRPMQSELRESGQIEESADVVLLLYRDEYYDNDTPNKGLLEVICTKNRNGLVGTVKFLFDASHTRVLNYKN